MKTCLLALLILVLPVFARNDFWMGNTYTVALSFGASDLGRQNAAIPKETPFPGYPYDMRRAGVTGSVMVEYSVTALGVVRDIITVTASTPEFERAVYDVLKGWKFHPALDIAAAKPVDSRMRCLVRFQMAEEKPNPALTPGPTR